MESIPLPLVHLPHDLSTYFGFGQLEVESRL
jgi:hypothetical protein